jgi:hypothetical protein
MTKPMSRRPPIPSPVVLYRLIEDGELRAVDIAVPGSSRQKTRLRSDDLDAYIEKRTRNPESPT